MKCYPCSASRSVRTAASAAGCASRARPAERCASVASSRPLPTAAASGYRTSLGADGPPTCYDDLGHADLVLVIGSNMAEAHPVTFDRLRDAKRARPDLTVVVVDPRRTTTADIADLYVPVAPGGDIALLNA